MSEFITAIQSIHPTVRSDSLDWTKWRLTYEGGDDFRNRYLEQFTTRESASDFQLRKKLTPVPRFAGAAIDDIRNSIFQRMRDITRVDGSQSYQEAVQGNKGGVDRNGNSMNAFLGTEILTDLLVLGKVGVFVDNSAVVGPTMASGSSKPYLYPYPLESILNWRRDDPENPKEFQAIMLRDQSLSFDPLTLMPSGIETRFRKLWLEDGRVRLQFYNKSGQEIGRDGNPSGPIDLELDRIPFVLIDLGRSLIKDVADYQIALLNLTSSDIWYALKSNFPFYVEQRDQRAIGSHLKRVPTADGTAEAGGQTAADEDARVGTTQGRYYDLKAAQPAFINPSPDPLKASMELQDKFEAKIRRLVNLAVATLSSRQSAESKSIDNQGLEAGLSFIGLVLQTAERQIAEHWSAYEQRQVSRRRIPTITYPDRYSLKNDNDRIEEADKLSDLMFRVPSQTAKKEISKSVINTLMSGRISVETLNKINKEIDESPYLTSDPKTILEAVKSGLVGEQVGSIALGFKDDEYLTAREDHAHRIARIQAAQTPDNPAARGNPDADPNPKSGEEERAAATNVDEQPDRKEPVRGEGQ